MDRPKLSIELICQDEEELIGQCCRYMIKLARAVEGLVEIVIVDGGSVDATCDIIKGIFLLEQPRNCVFSFKQRVFDNFSNQRNYIYSFLRGEWILNMATDHLFTDGMFSIINRLMNMQDVLTWSFGKVHLYRDIHHMMDVRNRDPMIALHRNDGKFEWKRSSVGLEVMAYDGEILIGHPAHFTRPDQRLVPEVLLIHFEALKNKDSLLRKYMKRTKLVGNKWYGKTEEEVWNQLHIEPAICPIKKYYSSGLKFYHEVDK